MVQASRGAFLDLLEPLILDDKLTALDPDVVKDMVMHYQTRGRLKRLEECVLHLDVQCIDLHQMVVLCWTHGLYDAMIYIYNRGRSPDVVAPGRTHAVPCVCHRVCICVGGCFYVSGCGWVGEYVCMWV